MHAREQRRALVWGARGFIGRHLVTELLQQQWPVTILTRPGNPDPPPAWGARVGVVEADPDRAPQAFAAAIADADVVFNLSGSSGAVASNREPLDSLDANCRMQLEFLTACASAPRPPHVVFASSRLVYAQADGPVAESHPVEPRSIYAAHKLCIEQYHRIFAQRGALTFTICRISNPYGLDHRSSGKGYGFINALIQNALAGQRLTLFGRGQQLRDYLFIGDLVDALVRCATCESARNETFNIGLGTSIPICTAALLIQQQLGGGPLEFIPWPAEYEAVESGDYVADVSRARDLIGFAPQCQFADGLLLVRERAAYAAA
jgi:UDP-glucose 4-epimerase